MLTKIKDRIISNVFIDEVIIKMNFNDDEYNKLVSDLNMLSNYLKNKNIIDKELALYLYTIPQMIRNIHSHFDQLEEKPELVFKLEDAWIELDGLVINCLS